MSKPVVPINLGYVASGVALTIVSTDCHPEWALPDFKTPSRPLDLRIDGVDWLIDESVDWKFQPVRQDAPTARWVVGGQPLIEKKTVEEFTQMRVHVPASALVLARVSDAADVHLVGNVRAKLHLAPRASVTAIPVLMEGPSSEERLVPDAEVFRYVREAPDSTQLRLFDHLTLSSGRVWGAAPVENFPQQVAARDAQYAQGNSLPDSRSMR